MKNQRRSHRSEPRLKLDPKAILITEQEIRADLLYPAAPRLSDRRP